MARKTTPDEAYNWAAHRCSLRECCSYDLTTKLMEKGLSRPEADAIIDRLTDENYINEERYARAFVHDKTLYDRWGRIKTRQALRMRGIDSDYINAAMDDIDEEEYVATLKSLLAQKQRSISADSDYEMTQKLVRFAASRGFEPEIVFRALEEMQ